ncbi:MAG TPA: NUDIX domain-containing protein [Dehalococcoidia bacterium]|nr:NUDIX domain-containing protein [Dehalococcoidia bacterium]
MSEDSRVGKVTAVCIRYPSTTTEVLVFDHPLDEGGLMVQLPAGTIEPDEAPEEAVMRELREETGVQAHSPLLAGVRDEDWQGEARRRWVYLLKAPPALADEWPFKCDCGADIRCYWLPLPTAAIVEAQQPWLEVARRYLASPQTPEGSPT